MSEYQIVHNPRCSKSRQTLALLQENGIEPTIIEYLKEPLTAAEIESIASKLAEGVESMVRRKEPLYKELGLSEQTPSATEWAQLLTKHPKLIERPIVINGNAARIGRPPETVLELL
ncbi:arsenate reductase (glutaredoxin) [Aliidiomarina sedimenti]|uniref:Arsenate reductase n=1 Tax=Aliidiomarina sedimenti TaxID=1933879 RepID=A0ABY0C143_9GAMM|nr:arsenate reductase (glutaredoxin) [Aliidiomarina sedimenti]RUO31522.1 arsenate reductase (glutaredoxin) [Aliidiomarina sedimenti]